MNDRSQGITLENRSSGAFENANPPGEVRRADEVIWSVLWSRYDIEEGLLHRERVDSVREWSYIEILAGLSIGEIPKEGSISS